MAVLDFEFPSVTAVRYADGYRLWLRFSDGVEGVADLAAWLKGPVFEPLRDQTQFARVRRYAGTIAWANGADVAPEALYDQLVPATGSAPKRSYEQLFDVA